MSKILSNLLIQLEKEGATSKEIKRIREEGKDIIVEVTDLKRWGEVVDEVTDGSTKSYKGGPERGH